MFKLKFGLIWTVIITIISVIYITNSGEHIIVQNMDFSVLIFLILFELIGLYLIISGLIKIIKDTKTQKYGTQCYAIVANIQETGSYSNNKAEYKAILKFVNPLNLQVEIIEEIIGFNYNKYPIDSYILCKYYQGDINIENIISENEVPGDIKKQLNPNQQEINF